MPTIRNLKSFLLSLPFHSKSIHSKPPSRPELKNPLHPPPENDDLDRCTICNSHLNAPRPDDNLTETLLVLPCSHTFGSICITRWLENDSPHKDCPQCRRSMLYTKCGHLIRPIEVERAPKAVREEEMPECCVVCRGDGLLGELMRKREEQERLARELREMREWLPSVWGGAMGCGEVVREEGKGWGKSVDDLRVLLERERVEW